MKLEKPIRKTPTFDEFKAIVRDIRAQRFSADAQDSADFVEFIGLVGLGQAETSTLQVNDMIGSETRSRHFATRLNPVSQFRSTHK